MHAAVAHPGVGVERAMESDAVRGMLHAEVQVTTVGPCSTRRHLLMAVGPAVIGGQ